MSILSMVATTAGIGGGAVYSALLMFVENFSAMEAFPISTFIILLTALCTYYIGVKDKIENPQHKFVDYDLVLVFCPSMLLGTKIGVIFNRILPSLLLNILLILLLAFSSYKIYYNAVKQRALEQVRAKNETQPFQTKRRFSLDEIYYEHYQETIIESPLKLSKNSRGLGNSLFSRSIRNDFTLLKNTLNKIDWYGDNSPVRIDRLKIVLLLQLIIILDQVLEGNDKFPSIIGISKCSMFYWFIFATFVLFCIFYAKYCYNMIRNQNKQSDQGDFNLSSEEGDKIINKIIFVCFLGGVISGMLGVGGGIIMAPLMLELGLDPKTTASTSNFLLIFTSSAGVVLFLLSQQLIFGYAMFFAIPCSICSLIGSSYITKIVTRTGKNSILVYCLFYVMVISLVILPINGIRHAVYDMKSGIDIFQFKSYC